VFQKLGACRLLGCGALARWCRGVVLLQWVLVPASVPRPLNWLPGPALDLDLAQQPGTGAAVGEGSGVGMARGSSSLDNHGIAVTTSAGCWPGLIGIRPQEGILEQVWDGAIGCGRRPCSAGDVFCSAALQPLFRQGGDGGVHVTLQHPFVGDGGLLRLLEPMQLDVTQEQRHHRPTTPRPGLGRARSMGLGVLPEAIGPFRGLVVLLEIGVHALGASPPVVDR